VENNGVSACVKELEDLSPFDAGLITVAGSGNSVLESFVQPFRFYTGYHVFVLKPKASLTTNQKLFYCISIRRNQFKYSYGRQANRTLKDLLVPALSEIPGSLIKLKAPEIKRTRLSNTSKNLDTSRWRFFKFGGPEGIFRLKKGYFNKKPDHTENGAIPFVGASMFNNGITEHYSIYDIETNDRNGVESSSDDVSNKIFKGNCITVANNGAGVGSAFYQRVDFTCSHDINVLYLKAQPFTIYTAMFLCALIQLDKYRWAYGRKWRPSRMPESEIKLPIDQKGNPDWKYMENYIKSLPYSSGLNN
jgi:hypothetical protein